MDANLVRGVASKLEAQAQTLSTIVGHLDGLVSRLGSAWNGSDFDEFVGWWRNQHRPALQRSHEAISGLAQSARNNASAQDGASDAGGSPVAATYKPAAYSSNVMATPAEIKLAEAAGYNATDPTFGKHFPQAQAKLKAWADELATGQHSTAEVQAFERYAKLCGLAQMQYVSVSASSELAVSSFNAGVSSSVDAASGGAASKTDAVTGTFRHQLEHAALKGGSDWANGKIRDTALEAVTSGSPDQINSAYLHSADQFLAGAGDQARAVTSLSTVNLNQITTSHENQLLSQQAELADRDNRADYTQLVTGHDDIVSSVAVGVSDLLAPELIPIRADLSAENAAMHFADSSSALNLALVAPLDNLAAAGKQMGLTQ